MKIIPILIVFMSLLAFFSFAEEPNAILSTRFDHYYFYPSNNQKITPKRYARAPRVTKDNYERFWSRGTFPTARASIEYHTRKHGKGRTPLQYTRDAVNFYAKNKPLRKPYILYNGSQGYKIKKGVQGGIWTKNGKIVTYWD